MFRCLFLAAALIAAGSLGNALSAQQGKLLTEPAAAQHGLVRAWVTQLGFDSARGRLCNLVLYEGTLYAQTDKATIEAIDAETGKMLWTRQIGRPEHPSMPPAVGNDYLAVINGSRLYVVNRLTGEQLLEREIEGSPGAGPALSAKRAYVPTVDGMVLAYSLVPQTDSDNAAGKAAKDSDSEAASKSEADEKLLRLHHEKIPPLFCRSLGRALVQPLVTHETPDDEFVAWPTDRGYLNVGYINRHEEKYLELRYRLGTDAPIVARPAYLPPDPKIVGDSGLILAVSGDGFVYAIREKDGNLFWKFSTGDADRGAGGRDRRTFVCRHTVRRNVLPRRQERQGHLVCTRHHAICRRQRDTGLRG